MSRRAFEILELLKRAEEMLKENQKGLDENPTSKTYRIRRNQLLGNIQTHREHLKRYGTTHTIYLLEWKYQNKKWSKMYTGLASESEALALFQIHEPTIAEHPRIKVTCRELKPGIIYSSNTGK